MSTPKTKWDKFWTVLSVIILLYVPALFGVPIEIAPFIWIPIIVFSPLILLMLLCIAGGIGLMYVYFIHIPYVFISTMIGKNK